MQIIIGLVLAIIGIIFYNNKRSKVIESILNNNKSKEELKDIDSQLTIEADKRKQLEDEVNRKKNEEVSKDNLLDFLNDPNKK